MKATNHFKNTIQAYLEERVASDTLFEWAYTKENKNLDDCITYILHAVQKSGCNGFTSEEIFSMAVHFYPKYIVIRSVQFIIVDIQLIGSTTC